MLPEPANAVKGHGAVDVHRLDVSQAGPHASPVTQDPASHVLGGKVHGETLGPSPVHAASLATLEPGLVRVLAAGSAGVVMGLVTILGRGMLPFAWLIGRGSRQVVTIGIGRPLTGHLGFLVLWLLHYLKSNMKSWEIKYETTSSLECSIRARLQSEFIHVYESIHDLILVTCQLEQAIATVYCSKES